MEDLMQIESDQGIAVESIIERNDVDDASACDATPPELPADAAPAPTLFYAATYYNAKKGIWHQVINLSGANEDEIVAMIDQRVPAENRKPLPGIRSFDGTKIADANVDSLQIAQQPGILALEKTSMQGRATPKP